MNIRSPAFGCCLRLMVSDYKEHCSINSVDISTKKKTKKILKYYLIIWLIETIHKFNSFLLKMIFLFDLNLTKKNIVLILNLLNLNKIFYYKE
jgi:hypothetical protein